MEFQFPPFTLTIIDLPTDVEPNTQDHLQLYERAYTLAPEHRPSTCYGVTCQPGDARCRITAGGGATSVTLRKVVCSTERCWIAISDQVASLSLPALELKWHKKLDGATCFQIFESPDKQGLLIHGEMEISKVSFDGELHWTTSGKDIFTGDFQIYSTHIEVEDFNGERYRINLSDGENRLIMQ